MTTLAISAAQAVGSTLVSSATSAAVSTASGLALSSATNAISRVFDNRVFEGPRLDSFHLQTSRDGAPMSRIYGRVRLAGQVIWASRIRETATDERVSGGKGGGPTQRNFSYSISFAIGLCEGDILGVDRIWANGTILQTAGLNFRVYTGSETQDPDPIIAATEGGDVSAFRGTAYIVFEDFPLDDFGARLPQINVEALRVPQSPTEQPRLEHMIKSVCLLPGSGEFSYSTQIVEETPSPGVTRPINMNNLSGVVDIELALDQLQAQLPNCKNVSIISAWFGTDLRCGSCEIQPGVEREQRVIRDNKWQVGRDDRGSAYLVSRDLDGRPNFGGSPSDESLVSAIQNLKARGFSVTLYPFMLMDIPPDNQLPNIRTNGFQPAFPWRGRVTATQDQSAQTRQQVDAFFGKASGTDFSIGAGSDHHRSPDYKYRNFILHHANIACRAGGVDRFIIGSEMRALTTLRAQDDSFPAVENMIDLAREVRSMLGSKTGITYAADWTEYFGYQPQDNRADVFYHLDELWADSAINAVGIDAYFPLSDWRETPNHLDVMEADNIYDISYLSSQIEGGEGYDYFYANQSEREAQTRSDITDGGALKPWVFRYKDVRNWWQNPHYERRNGIELDKPTAWQAQGKPIWFTEIGCPAIHHGANQPNVFSDPKSTESEIPYFSNGSRDELIQRTYLEAMIGYWEQPQINPMSEVYNEPMIDTNMMSVWAWDARPFPDFPARNSVWSDGDNWQVGHWLTGRMGLMPISYVVEDLSRQAGLDNLDVTGLNGVLQGYHIYRPMSARAALGPLMDILNLELSEREGNLVFQSPDITPITAIDDTYLAAHLVSPINFGKEDPEQALRDVRVHFIDITNDYQLGSISARDRGAETVRITDLRLPIVMDQNYANFLAQQQLDTHHLSMQNLSLALSPLVALSFHVGDKIHVSGYDGLWRLDNLDIGTQTDLSLTRVQDEVRVQTFGSTPNVSSDPVFLGRPTCLAFDVSGPYDGPLVGAIMTPFEIIDISGPSENVAANIELRLGALLTDLPSGPIARWDKANQFELFMPNAKFSSVSDEVLLSGANKFALETQKGWEVVQARDMQLIAPDRYKCTVLLRGLDGSASDMDDNIKSGARVIWLNQGVFDIPLSAGFLQESVDFQCDVNGRRGDAAQLTYVGRHLRPLAPVHVQALHDGKILTVNWIRQTRINGDIWAGDVPLGETQELYRVQIFNNEAVLLEADTPNPQYSVQVDEATHVQIAQYSSVYGLGVATRVEISKR